MSNANKTNQDRAIEENLKRVFDDVLEEGIPDRFKDLLSQLKDQDAQKDKKS